jgi:hypothetical protein
MPLQTSQQPLTGPNQQNPGNALTEVAKIRIDGQKPWGPEVSGDMAQAIHNLQNQLDVHWRAISSTPQPLQTFSVVNAMGALIGWIGSRVVGVTNYIGAWFREIRIGGTDASNAAIVADSSGNVSITGAAITLNRGGVLTTIQNNAGPDGLTESLNSLDITVAHGQQTIVTPYSFSCWAWDPTNLIYSPVAALSAGGAPGSTAARLILNRFGSPNTITMSLAGGGGAPFIVVDNGTTPIVLSAVDGITVGGIPVVDIARNAAFVALAISGSFTGTHAQNVGTADTPAFAGVSAGAFTAAGSPGITVTDSLVSAITPASASFVDSVSTATSTINYAPGAVSATFVTAIGTTTNGALTAATPTIVGHGYTKGIRTS